MTPDALARPFPAEVATVTRLRAVATFRAAAWIAFCAGVVLSPLRAALTLLPRTQPGVFHGYTDLAISAGEIALVAALACWAVALALQPRRLWFGPAFLRWPCLGLLAAAWLSVPFSIDPVLSAFRAVDLVAMAALGVFVLNEVEGPVRLAVPLGLTVASQSAVAIGQLVEQRSIGLQWLGENVLDPRLNGASVVAASGLGRLLRAYGLTGHPNILGGVLAIGLLLLAAASSWGGPSSGGRIRPVLRALTIAAGAGALFATLSRSAWLAVGVGLVVAIGFGSRSFGIRTFRLGRPRLSYRPVAAALAAALAAVLLVALVVGYGRFVAVRLGLSGADSVTEAMSIGERTILADQTLRIGVAHALTGTGLGTLPAAIHAGDPTLTFSDQPAHVVLLDVAAETGVVGALSYIALVVAPWIALARRPRRWTPAIAATSAALAAVTVVGLFDHYEWTAPTGRIWTVLVLGLYARAWAQAHLEPRAVAAGAAARGEEYVST